MSTNNNPEEIPIQYPATPELDKMKEVADESQKIGNFIEWLDSQDIVLAQWDSDGQLSAGVEPIENVLALYFDIDLEKVEKERSAVVEYVQKCAAQKKKHD